MEEGGSSKPKTIVGVSVSIEDSKERSKGKNVDCQLPLPPLPKPSYKSRSSLILDNAIEYELQHIPHDLNPDDVDIKKLRRKISNRFSAQRSRKKKASYIEILEKNLLDEEKKVSALNAQLQVHQEKNNGLLKERESLQLLIQIRMEENKRRELEVERQKEELRMLKESDSNSSEESTLPNQTQPYYCSIEFYSKGLEKLIKRCEERAKAKAAEATASAAAVPSTDEDSALQHGEEAIQAGEEAAVVDEEVDISQFINFEALETEDPWMPGI